MSVAVCFRRASPFLTGRPTRLFAKIATVSAITGQGHHARKDDGRHDRVPKVRSDRRLVRRGEAVMQFEDPVHIWDAGGHRDTRLNLHERLVQLNLQERLRAPDLRVLHSPHLRGGVYGGSHYLRNRPGAVTELCGGLCGISLWCLSLRARAKWRS